MKKTLPNCGELPMYHAENTHEAIISMKDFQTVQDEIARRAAKHNRTTCGPLSSPFHFDDRLRHLWQGIPAKSDPHRPSVDLQYIQRLRQNRLPLQADSGGNAGSPLNLKIA